MSKKEANKIIFKIDFKYGKILKILAKEELNRFHSVPLLADDLYNCFMYKVPQIVPTIEGDEKKFLNTLKLYARRFYFKKCREYTARKYVIMNQSSRNADLLSDSKQNNIIEFTDLNYSERIIYSAIVNNKYASDIVSKKLKITKRAAQYKIKKFKSKFQKFIRNH